MFFTLSKILAFVIQPLVWLIGLLTWAVFTKNAAKKRSILRGVLFMTVVLTNPFLMFQTFKLYETPAVPMDSLRDTFDVGIVLGGFSNFDAPADDRLNFNFAVNRLTDALLLYKKGIIKKILITGGDGSLLRRQRSEALETGTYLLQMGVPQTDILLESESRNTRENAVFTKKMLDSIQLSSKKLLLITSAFHMPRSMGCFKKVGLTVQAFPANFIGQTASWRTSYWLEPDSDAFTNWKLILKEWVGYGMYWLQGYI